MAEPFTRIEAVAAALPLENVDTDMIWPAMPGAPLTRGAQARQAFHRLRFAPTGPSLRTSCSIASPGAKRES